MDRLIAGLRAIARGGVWFGGALIILSAVLIGVEVVIRKAFNLTIGGVDELAGFALAISSAWAFGFALLDRAHVRIDSLYIWLPARVRAALDLLGLAAFTLFMALLAWQAFGVFGNSLAMGTRTMTVLATPLQYPQFLWAVGLAFFVLVAVILFARAVWGVLHGDLVAVQRCIGSRTMREELDQELEQLGKIHDGTP